MRRNTEGINYSKESSTLLKKKNKGIKKSD